jgi:hypothetical protein
MANLARELPAYLPDLLIPSSFFYCIVSMLEILYLCITGSTATTTVTTSATLVPSSSSFTPSASSTADTDKQQERRPSWRLRMESGDRSRVSTVPSSVVDPHHVDADPDSTYHLDADPDFDFLFEPDPSFKKRLEPFKNAKIGSYSITFWSDICKLMEIRIRFRIQLIIFLCESECRSGFYLMRMRIRIHNTGT